MSKQPSVSDHGCQENANNHAYQRGGNAVMDCPARLSIVPLRTSERQALQERNLRPADRRKLNGVAASELR
jgi:hypothetical protein